MAIRRKYTRRAYKTRRKTKKRAGVRNRHPEYEVREHMRAHAHGYPPPNLRVQSLKRHNIIYKVMNGEPGVDAYNFMTAKNELMKIARDDLFTNKDNPEIFLRIINYAARATGGGSTSPGRWRGHWAYSQCLECYHDNGLGFILPEFQLTQYQELTNIPHNFESIRRNSTCDAGGCCDKFGRIPCWVNKKFD